MTTLNKRVMGSLVAGGLAFAGVIAGTHADAAVGVDTTELRDALTVDAIRAHQTVLQEIANDNGGTREASSPGYFESVEYVADLLRDAGYEVDVQDFEYSFFEDFSAPTLTAGGISYVDYSSNYPDGDFATMTYSGSGTLTDAPIEPVDLALADPASSTSGCESEDFVGFPTGAIALMQRGECSFAQKAVNAELAGASAAIIFNQGNDDPTDDRFGAFFGTLGAAGTVGADFPVFSASYDLGVTLSGLATASLSADSGVTTRQSQNVIADTPTGRDDRVVVVGAHLDSVVEGPGINDNGSGVAVILEIALQMAELGIEPTNQVRFAFWGAEEAGLYGSEYYVDQLTKRELKDIAVNLNFDMLGSPNYVRFVYDGDGSDGAAGPNGSGVVEQVFLDYFDQMGLATEPTEFDGRSDYGPFIAAGIPAGGLFSGAEGIKTEAQADAYGGTAGVAYDPCYHLACDTLANVSLQALDELGDAAAHAVLTFADTTSAVNGTGKASSKAIEMAFKADRAVR